MSEPVRICGPSDVLAAIPSLLGFRPQGSVVLLALRPDGVVACVARADLPGEGDLADWSASFLPAVDPVGEVHAILAGFSIPGDDERLAACFASLSTMLRHRGCVVLDMIAVLGGRWRSVMCRDADCCPPDGWPVETLDEDFMRVRLGVPSVADNRDALVHELEPGDGDTLTPVEPGAPALNEPERDDAIRAVVDHLVQAVGAAWGAGEVLRVLRDVRVRDTVLWDLIHEHPDRWQVAAAALTGLVRGAPDHAVAPVATLLAVVRWQMGDGARARIAVDRALRVAPDYGLALLIEGLLDHGQPPWTWRAALAELPRAACRGAG